MFKKIFALLLVVCTVSKVFSVNEGMFTRVINAVTYCLNTAKESTFVFLHRNSQVIDMSMLCIVPASAGLIYMKFVDLVAYLNKESAFVSLHNDNPRIMLAGMGIAHMCAYVAYNEFRFPGSCKEVFEYFCVSIKRKMQREEDIQAYDISIVERYPNNIIIQSEYNPMFLLNLIRNSMLLLNGPEESINNSEENDEFSRAGTPIIG